MSASIDVGDFLSRIRYDDHFFFGKGIPLPQAVVDPEELRRFALHLKKFTQELEEKSAALAGQMQTLSTTWRDQEHLRFSEEFSQHLKVLGRFIESNQQHVPYLLRKAERIEEYLQQR